MTNCGKLLKRREHQTTFPVSQETCVQVRWEHQTTFPVSRETCVQVRWEHQTTFPVSRETCVQVKKQHLEPHMEWLTGVQQRCLLSPCLLNLYSEHIMRKAGLDELQAGIEIGGRNINNHRCVDDTTLMAECEEDLRSFLMRVKEESERAGLRLNIKKLRSWLLALLLHGK